MVGLIDCGGNERMKHTYTRYIFLFLSLLWMTVIFIYSSKEVDESKRESSKYALFLCENFISDYDELQNEEKIKVLNEVDYYIRKLAHFVEYALLGFLVAGFIIVGNVKRRENLLLFLVAWFIGTLYAASDEYHQLFVPGRSGQFSDVLLDSCGVLTGVFFYNMYIKIFIKKGKINSY